MAQITITIPNNKVGLVKDALGYQDKIANEEGVEIDNPQTPQEFAQEWIIKQIRLKVRKYEKTLAANNVTHTDVNIT